MIVKKAQGKPRKRGRWGLVMILVCASLLLFLQQDMFRVRYIKLSDELIPDAQAIIDASGIAPGMGMLFISADTVRARISENLYYDFRGMELKWPNTVVLAVGQRRLFAAVDSLGVILSIDAHGFILARGEVLPEGDIVVVTGAELTTIEPGSVMKTRDPRQQICVSAVLEAMDALKAQGYVSELNVADTDNMLIYARSGIQVLIGNADNIIDKLRWMSGALDALHAQGETTGTLDVSTGVGAYFKGA